MQQPAVLAVPPPGRIHEEHRRTDPVFSQSSLTPYSAYNWRAVSCPLCYKYIWVTSTDVLAA
jgi:hypothetical protein